MFKKVAGIFFALTLGLSSGWILRGQEPRGTIAMVYYWKAKPGKLEDYNHYIKTVGEPIDSRRSAPVLSSRSPRTSPTGRILPGRTCVFLF